MTERWESGRRWPTNLRAWCFLFAAAAAAADFDAVHERATAVLVTRHGRPVHEWYAPGWGPARPHYTASLAKALVGGMSLLASGLDPDTPAAKYIPAWRGHPLKARITLRHLATHSSGIEDAEEGKLPHDKLPGWKGAFWKRQPDPFSIALRDAPVIFEPGTRYHYSNPGMAALAYAVTAAAGDLRMLIAPFMRGVPEAEWSIGYGRAYELDGLKLYANWGGGSYTARAVAHVGQWMMEHPVERMVAYASTPLPDRSEDRRAPGSGLCWYTNFDGIWPALPRDAFAGAGAGHQILVVVPSWKLVAVRQGEKLGEPFWQAAFDRFLKPLAAAALPYPASEFAAEFGPVLRRDAPGSDNWPVTAGSDGRLYAAYGDGWGFEPRTQRKLSLGFARIEGAPESFRGVNVRSDGERTGDGKAGPKASGLLVLDGVLYMWVRNVGNAQLAWSEDGARTWQWGFRLEHSFGSPAFLNPARGDYVYTYSQDGPSAYESCDGVVLARAPRGRLRDPQAWEFFVRPGEWTRDIARRRPVFTFPGHCQRVDAVYNRGLRRYLLALGYNHASGWGIFAAPEPWGPWSTVFHTETWDLAGGHGYRLPVPWISPDGRAMGLIFSGTGENDAFCVRRILIKNRGN